MERPHFYVAVPLPGATVEDSAECASDREPNATNRGGQPRRQTRLWQSPSGHLRSASGGFGLGDSQQVLCVGEFAIDRQPVAERGCVFVPRQKNQHPRRRQLNPFDRPPARAGLLSAGSFSGALTSGACCEIWHGACCARAPKQSTHQSAPSRQCLRPATTSDTSKWV